MKRVKNMISILVRIISIARMKLVMLRKAKKPNHFAYKMGLQTSLTYIKILVGKPILLAKWSEESFITFETFPK
jgi:hypothetical protein